MSEVRALVLGFAVMLSTTAAAFIGLRAVDARDEVLVAVLLLIVCASAFGLSGVVMHYAPPDERRRR
jgi:hypothetical protein